MKALNMDTFLSILLGNIKAMPFLSFLCPVGGIKFYPYLNGRPSPVHFYFSWKWGHPYPMVTFFHFVVKMVIYTFKIYYIFFLWWKKKKEVMYSIHFKWNSHFMSRLFLSGINSILIVCTGNKNVTNKLLFSKFCIK